MDITHVLRDILVVLVAAKVAAELAERVGIPAVVGEILAGILIGPSLLGAVGHSDEVLRTLGEIGVILLLLDVGLEMDIGELGKVGRASILVATVGVVTPMLLGIGVMELIGQDFNTSLFVGAALTATSVGITARVFGDLRALATTEARIVLGAAVADDVMGLIVLTVVVRLVTEGSVSVLSLAWIVLVAVAFLLLGGLVGLRVAPPLFGLVERVSRSTGTMVAIALAFTLGFAQLADAAQLAPIVGAFVAGIALSRSAQSDRIRRELAPVGHLFIPVFFLQIGIDADLSAFGSVTVLRDAALLLVVAVIGKLVSPLGAIGSPGDKMLIGLGMLPRGEVGLIFATIGLQSGVLDDDLYAALLLVVLITTLVTPQLLKMRYSRLRRETEPTATPPGTPAPDEGWLRVTADEVHLAAQPPDEEAIAVAFDAAIALARRRPGDDLLDWLARLADAGQITWTVELTDKLLDVIERGNARTWRFLDASGVLERALPDIAAAFTDRERDSFSLDPLTSHRVLSMERLRMLDESDPLALEMQTLEHVDRLLLASWLTDVLEDESRPERTARAVLDRLVLPSEERAKVAELVEDRDLLWSAARQPGALTEDRVLGLAAHLDTPERARALYILSALRSEGRERWELARLSTLHDLVQATLTDDRLSGMEARNLTEQRRQDAAAHVNGGGAALERIASAPQAFVLRQTPAALARLVRLLDPPLRANQARVSVTAAEEGGWWVDVGTHDRPGLLAVITGVLADAGLAVDDAVLAVWPDGVVVDTFRVTSEAEPSADELRAAVERKVSVPLTGEALPDAEVDFDNAASPWHTVCEVRATDRPRLLHSLAAAFAAAGVDVRSAAVSAADGLVIDRFEVLAHGDKLGAREQERLCELIPNGVSVRRRRFGRRLVVKAASPEPRAERPTS